MSIMPYTSPETAAAVRSVTSAVNAMTTEQLLELRAQFANVDSLEARTILALLAEIDVLDEALAASEDEVERLRAKVEPKAVSGSVSRTANGRWRARWRTPDGKQHSETFDRRRTAELFLDEAKREAR